jgi:hypothetical protein
MARLTAGRPLWLNDNTMLRCRVLKARNFEGVMQRWCTPSGTSLIGYVAYELAGVAVAQLHYEACKIEPD